jgi:hypothetical protein
MLMGGTRCIYKKYTNMRWFNILLFKKQNILINELYKVELKVFENIIVQKASIVVSY